MIGDALRGRQSGVKGHSGWKVGEKDFALAYLEKRRICEEHTVCADKFMGVEMDKKRMK